MLDKTQQTTSLFIYSIGQRFFVFLVIPIVFILGCKHGGHSPSAVTEEITEQEPLIEPVNLEKELSFTLPNNNSIRLNRCPAGVFTMGSPETEPSHQDDETMHSVTISKDFYLGIYEVTQAQYEAVMGSNPSKFKNQTDSTSRPVEKVTYSNAKAFCNWLNTNIASDSLPTGYYFDLPTEAQWEYACRAGTATGLNNGTDIPEEEIDGICPTANIVAWYYYNSKSNGEYQSHKVGEKAANSWGLYDMHGNVWEWCKDYYGDYPTSDVTDPQGAIMGLYRVVRGGSWRNNPYKCRSAFRGNVISEDSFYSLGFRVALVKK